MKCPDCGHPLVDGSYLCANAVCPFMLKRCPEFAGMPFESHPREFTLAYDGAEPVPVAAPPEPFEVLRLPRPVIGPTSLAFRFCGEGEGRVEFTYEEMLALQRVARAQIEMER